MSLEEKQGKYEKWGGLVAVVSSLEDTVDDPEIDYFKDLFDRIDQCQNLYRLYKLVEEPTTVQVDRINSPLFDQIKAFIDLIKTRSYGWRMKCAGETTIRAFEKVTSLFETSEYIYYYNSLFSNALDEGDVVVIRWLINSPRVGVSSGANKFKDLISCSHRPIRLEIIQLFTDFQKYEIRAEFSPDETIDYLLQQGADVLLASMITLIQKDMFDRFQKCVQHTNNLSAMFGTLMGEVVEKDRTRYVRVLAEKVKFVHKHVLKALKNVKPTTSIETIRELFNCIQSDDGFLNGPSTVINEILTLRIPSSKRMELSKLFFEEVKYPCSTGYILDLIRQRDDPVTVDYLLNLTKTTNLCVLSCWMDSAIDHIENLELLYSKGARPVKEILAKNLLVRSFLSSKEDIKWSTKN